MRLQSLGRASASSRAVGFSPGIDVLAAEAMSASVKPNSAIICPVLTIVCYAVRCLFFGCPIQ